MINQAGLGRTFGLSYGGQRSERVSKLLVRLDQLGRMLFAIGCTITIVFACLHIVGHYRYVLNDCRTPPPLPPQVTRISISVAVVLGGLIGWLKNGDLPPAVARGTVVSLQVMGVGLAINWSVVILSGFREMDFGTYFVPFLLMLALVLGVSEGLIHRRLRALSGDPPDRE